MKLKNTVIIILGLNSILMLIYGAAVMVNPALITNAFQKYSGLNWSVFSNENVLAASYLIRLIRLLGVFNIILGIIAVIALYHYNRSNNAVLLAILFFCNIVVYAASVAFDLSTGVIGAIEIIEIIVFILSVWIFAMHWLKYLHKV